MGHIVKDQMPDWAYGGQGTGEAGAPNDDKSRLRKPTCDHHLLKALMPVGNEAGPRDALYRRWQCLVVEVTAMAISRGLTRPSVPEAGKAPSAKHEAARCTRMWDSVCDSLGDTGRVWASGHPG